MESASTPVAAGDRTAVETTVVVDWLRTELDDPDVTAADNFLDVGGHSLTFAKLNRFLRETHGILLDQKVTYAEEIGTAVAAARPAPDAESVTR